MSEDIHETAARWFSEQSGPEMDWDGFTRWLEADARHGAAFDEIALLDDRLDLAKPMLARACPSADDDDVRPRPAYRQRWFLTAAAAAAVLGVGVIGTQLPLRPDTSRSAQVVQTKAGEVREVMLADGSKAVLGAGSVLHIAGRDTPIALEGSAVFEIRHDEAHPLIVQAGGYEIRDVGTRFEVSTAPGMFRVAVAEGLVAVRSPDAVGEVTVGAGQSLTALGNSGALALGVFQPKRIGSWRGGQLAYDDVPLGLVVAEVSRYTGQRLELEPRLAGRRFSGVIAIGSSAAMVSTLEQLTGLHAHPRGNTTRLGDGAGD